MLSPRLKAPSAPPDLRAGFERIRARMNLPEEFPKAVLADAEQAAERTPAEPSDRRDIDFLTIDPPGSKDLDQALHGERMNGGFRVHYAVADVGTFVDPGSPLEAEAANRGKTLYCPDRRIPLYPQLLGEGAASLLPDMERPAVLWTFDLDGSGVVRKTAVRRALVLSRRRLTYHEAQEQIDSGNCVPTLQVLRQVGLLRQELERKRGGVDLQIPEQEVLGNEGNYRLEYRSNLPVELWNAQISLMTGMAAAEIMLSAGVGLLRTLPPPSEEAIETLRISARGLGQGWPEGMSYQEFIRSLDPAVPVQAAMLTLARSLFRGVGYTFFDGAEPANTKHYALAAPYAHVTAPLRRLADRLTNEVVLSVAAGGRPPEWMLDRLAEAPVIMKKADHTDRELQSRVVDFVEAALLKDRVGEIFQAVVLEAGAKSGTVQLREPAVLGPCEGSGLPLGERIEVILTEADPIKGSIRFKPSDPTPEEEH